jgi:hypothetical protein
LLHPKRGRSAEGDANSALALTSSIKISASKLSALGDSFMLQSEYPLETRQQIKELFGSEFAEKSFSLNPAGGSGPCVRDTGIVFIQQKLPSRIPEIAEVRNQVLTESKNGRLQAASEAFYVQLRKRYRVEIDKSALAPGESKPAQPVGAESASESAPDLD